MYYIYRITNKVNGKTYIGQHKYKMLNDSYMGSGKRLWEAYRKYGIENFEKQILVFNISKREHTDLLEKTFITSEREKVGIKNCYNLADGGNGGNLGEDVNKKISESHKGKTPWNKGKHCKPLTEEHRRKISEALKGIKGRPLSEEHRKKLSEAHKGKPTWNKGKKGLQASWIKGKHHSEESRKKMSEALKGRQAWNKGKSDYLSEESRKKMSESKKGENNPFYGKHWKIVDGKRVYY